MEATTGWMTGPAKWKKMAGSTTRSTHLSKKKQKTLSSLGCCQTKFEGGENIFSEWGQSSYTKRLNEWTRKTFPGFRNFRVPILDNPLWEVKHSGDNPQGSQFSSYRSEPHIDKGVPGTHSKAFLQAEHRQIFKFGKQNHYSHFSLVFILEPLV